MEETPLQQIMRRLGQIENKIGYTKEEPKEDLSQHLKICPNCQNAISEIVKKKFDVDEIDEDEEEEDEDFP